MKLCLPSTETSSLGKITNKTLGCKDQKLFVPSGKAVFLRFYVTPKNPPYMFGQIFPCHSKTPGTGKYPEKTHRTQTSGMFACSMNKQEIQLANKQAQRDLLLSKFYSFVTLTNLSTLGIFPRAIL